MKKLVSCILAFSLLLVVSVAQVTVDVESMSLEDLSALSGKVSYELQKRLGKKSVRISEGVYKEGSSIRAGSYIFVCTDTEPYQMYDGQVIDNSAFRIVGGYAGQETIYNNKYFPVGTEIVFTIEEGQTLQIRGCAGELSVYTALIDLLE